MLFTAAPRGNVPGPHYLYVHYWWLMTKEQPSIDDMWTINNGGISSIIINARGGLNEAVHHHHLSLLIEFHGTLAACCQGKWCCLGVVIMMLGACFFLWQKCNKDGSCSERIALLAQKIKPSNGSSANHHHSPLNQVMCTLCIWCPSSLFAALTTMMTRQWMMFQASTSTSTSTSRDETI